MRPEHLFDEALFSRNAKLFDNRFCAVLERYLIDFEDYLNEMQIGLNQQDSQRVSCAAHALKSASSTLGVTKVSELTADIEHTPLENEPSDKIATMVQELNSLYLYVKAELFYRHADIAS